MVGHPNPVMAGILPMQRQHTYHPHAVPTARPMVRTTSTRSDRGNVPFTPIGPIAPMPPVNTGGVADHLIGAGDVPLMTMMPNTRPRRQSELETLHEHMMPDVGEDVSAFLARHGAVYSDPFALTSSSMPVLPYDALTPSTCPSMVSGPSAAEDGAMSRVNSSFDTIAMSRASSAFTSTSMGDSFDMSRLDSTRSQYMVQRPIPSPKGASLEELFAGMGASLPSNGGDAAAFGAPIAQSPSMQRSVSCASIKSTTSNLERRAKEATQRHIMNSKTEIRPKPCETSQSPSAMPHVPISPSSSSTRPRHAIQPAASKSSSSSSPSSSSAKRAKQPKIMCLQCDDQPDGFRGEHELRRHIASKHTAQAKRWVCRDPRDYGIHTSLKPIKPLNKCKYCLENKQYNIDYNAAAHLRRIHFNPKTTRAKNKTGTVKRGVAAIAEKRGGKGGGDQPVIEDLRHWLMEITVDVQQPLDGALTDDSEDQEMDDIEDTTDLSVQPPPAAPAVGALAVDLNSMPIMFGSDLGQTPFEAFSGLDVGSLPNELNIFNDMDFGNCGLMGSSMSDSTATLTPNMFAGYTN
jgi:hypothetical protein